MRHGQAFWPGVVGCISAEYSTGHGISPGIASLTIPDQDVSKIAIYGTLIITDLTGTVTLPGSRVQSINFSTDGGRRITLQIADRRWRWRYGFITAKWNIIDPYPDLTLFPPGEFVNIKGPYAPGTYRTAGNMMRDCLARMNEDYVINIEPTEPLTQVWNEDVPAQALAQVCDAINYRVCLQTSPPTRTLISPQGVGLALPDNLPIISTPPSVQISKQPAKIRLVGAEVIYTDIVRLEPVGLEPTGEILPIDQLSYKPPRGWANTAPSSFFECPATAQLTQQEAAELAARCIWRMFRIEMSDQSNALGAGPNIGGYGLVKDRKQIKLLPQMFGYTKNVQGQFDTSPPRVYGSMYVAKGEGRLLNGLEAFLGNTDPQWFDRLPRTPQIDSERGLVTFDRQCYFKTTLNAAPWTRISAPTLWLHTSMNICDVVGRVPVKYARDGGNPPEDLGLPPEIVHHPELTLVVNTVRERVGKKIVDISTNEADLIPPANYYLDRAREKYQIAAAMTRTYAGIYPLNLDGARQQITWRVGGGMPATTTVSINAEHDPYVSPYPERRRREQIIAFNGKAIGQNFGAGGAFDSESPGSAPPAVPPGQ